MSKLKLILLIIGCVFFLSFGGYLYVQNSMIFVTKHPICYQTFEDYQDKMKDVSCLGEDIEVVFHIKNDGICEKRIIPCNGEGVRYKENISRDFEICNKVC